MAGICAAISAARTGLKVALIHDRPVLGGNNSSEVRVGLSGEINLPPYPALGAVVREVGPIGYWDWQEALKDPDLPRSKEVLEVIEHHPEKKIHNAGPAPNYEDDKKTSVVQAEENIHLFLNMHAGQVEKDGDAITAVVAKDIVSSHPLRIED